MCRHFSDAQLQVREPQRRREHGVAHQWLLSVGQQDHGEHLGQIAFQDVLGQSRHISKQPELVQKQWSRSQDSEKSRYADQPRRRYLDLPNSSAMKFRTSKLSFFLPFSHISYSNSQLGSHSERTRRHVCLGFKFRWPQSGHTSQEAYQACGDKQGRSELPRTARFWSVWRRLSRPV